MAQMPGAAVPVVARIGTFPPSLAFGPCGRLEQAMVRDWQMGSAKWKETGMVMESDWVTRNCGRQSAGGPRIASIHHCLAAVARIIRVGMALPARLLIIVPPRQADHAAIHLQVKYALTKATRKIEASNAIHAGVRTRIHWGLRRSCRASP